jgi:hypothetical protein
MSPFPLLCGSCFSAFQAAETSKNGGGFSCRVFVLCVTIFAGPDWCFGILASGGLIDDRLRKLVHVAGELSLA